MEKLFEPLPEGSKVKVRTEFKFIYLKQTTSNGSFEGERINKEAEINNKVYSEPLTIKQVSKRDLEDNMTSVCYYFHEIIDTPHLAHHFEEYKETPVVINTNSEERED